MKKCDFTPEDEQQIRESFQALLTAYASTHHRQKVDIITRAFTFANQAHYGMRRLSGEPYIMHPLAVARIVVKEIGLGSTSICAALLHDVVEDTDYTVKDIADRFGLKIAQIVDGMTKISGGVFADQAAKQAENFRKLLLTMSDDIRVVLVKLADRLHNMRTLDAQTPEKQRKISQETQYLYAPLAHRLGFFPIKLELENLSFKYEYPDLYKQIDDRLTACKDMQMENFETFAKPIRDKLKEMGIQFTITARIKSVYSIFKKMQRKNIPFEDVYDLLAVRIVFTPNEQMSEKDQCWIIYAAITELYHPHPERIRDWISTPKANGYEALHITVMGTNGRWVEVQIRSQRMHEIAERGLAAHWKYKSNETNDDSELDHWLQEVKEVLENPDPDAMTFLDNFKLSLFAHEVFVFTPTGEVKTLPQHASVLDFAYMIHTQIGEHCTGAKVNHQLQPVSYRFNSGDQVEILTSENTHPVPEWLNMVETAKAQDAIRKYINRNAAKQQSVNTEPFSAYINMRGVDRFGMLIQVIQTISDKMQLNMRDLHIQVKDQLFDCQVEVEVYSNETTECLCAALRKIQGLTYVENVNVNENVNNN